MSEPSRETPASPRSRAMGTLVALAAGTLLGLPACRASLLREPAWSDLLCEGRLVAQCASGYDAARHADTCKVYHRLFAPDGRQITKDLGGTYDHHRGLFFGFNRLRAGGESWDFWHCRRGESQRLVSVAPRSDPSVMDLAIDWITGHGEIVLRERRRIEARPVPRGHALEIAIELRAVSKPVELDGDPQHSGFQVRALQRFADPDGPKVGYLRPETARGGEDDVWTGCDWVAGVLPMEGTKVTVLHEDLPGNPRPVRYSTRPYGRFGSTFRARVEPGEPLRLRYRVAVLEGKAGRAEIQSLLANRRP
ncbi:MAG: hypothetical protein Fur0037_13100 [Planctomycetota bacterium]